MLKFATMKTTTEIINKKGFHDLEFNNCYIVKTGWKTEHRGTLHKRMKEGFTYLTKKDLGKGLYRVNNTKTFYLEDGESKYFSEEYFMSILHKGHYISSLLFIEIKDITFIEVALFEKRFILYRERLIEEEEGSFTKEMIQESLSEINKILKNSKIQKDLIMNHGLLDETLYSFNYETTQIEFNII